MGKIKIFGIFSIFLLSSANLYSTLGVEDDNYLVDKKENNLSRNFYSELIKSQCIRPYAQELDNLNNREEESNNYTCESSTCWSNVWYCWNRINGTLKKLLIWKPNSAQSQGTNICVLPNELLLHIAKFLASTDILRLSGTHKEFRQVFNEDYWSIYLSKVSISHSYLILNSSASLERRAFFSHLWYSEGLINLAAKLNHPEALIIRVYGSYGAYIGKDQYVCPLGFIRHISGKIDYERTDILGEAKRKKVAADLARNKTLRQRKEQGIKYGLRFM